VTDASSCRSAIEEAAAGLGGIDALLYSTGVGHLGRLVDAGVDAWQRSFSTNVPLPVSGRAACRRWRWQAGRSR
jgi:NAD(P)-dependent dehydrogenase (short-subunit alcohol dehydrogenase family)